MVNFSHPTLVERLAAIESRMHSCVLKKLGDDYKNTTDFAEIKLAYQEIFNKDLERRHPEAINGETDDGKMLEGGDMERMFMSVNKLASSNQVIQSSSIGMPVSLRFEKGQEKESLL